MKKLISLLAALAVVSTCTMSAFAFSVETTDSEGKTTTTAMTVTTVDEPEVYEADATTGKYTVDASVAGTQDQTTILAVKGEVVRLGSIEYIDQSATQSFSFALRNELAAGETVNVLVGGSNGTVYNTGYMQGASESTDPEEPTTYTVSGTVENFASQDFIDEMSGYVVDLYGEDEVENFVAEYSTTAYLIDLETIDEFVAYHTAEADTFSYLKKSAVSAEDGTYSFSEVENGTYALAIARSGALPYMNYLTVEGANVTVDSVKLLMGDQGTVDYLIDNDDILAVFDAISEIGEDNFVPNCDFYSDCLIDNDDIVIIFENIGDVTDYDTELIYDLFS